MWAAPALDWKDPQAHTAVHIAAAHTAAARNAGRHKVERSAVPALDKDKDKAAVGSGMEHSYSVQMEVQECRHPPK